MRRVVLTVGRYNSLPRYNGVIIRTEKDSWRPVSAVRRAFGWPKNCRVNTCNVCGVCFVGHHKQAQCSGACQRIFLQRQRAPHDHKRAEARRQHRQKVAAVCACCGRLLTAQRSTRRYCSAACRQWTWRRQQQDKAGR